MKYKYKSLFIFLLLISLISISSCNANKKVEKSETNRKEITIYILCSKVASRYSFALGSYDGVQVNPVYFDDNLEKLQNRLNLELMVGEGPDVVCTTDDRTTDIVKSVYKLASSNTLIDLNPFMNADKKYKEADYNKIIMNSGIYNAKRFFIPRLYAVPALITTKEKLDVNDINISGNRWSWEDFLNTCKNFMITRKDKRQALIFDYEGKLLIDLIANSKTQFIDYSSKVTKFNTRDFISLLKDYKDYIYPVTMTDTESNENALLADDNLAVMRNIQETGDPLTYMALDGYLGMMDGNANQDQKNSEAYILPSYGNGDIYGLPREMFGITSRCKYKQAAYDFIQNLVKSTNINIGHSPIAGVAVYKPLFNLSLEAAAGKVPLTDIGMHPNRALNGNEKIFFGIVPEVSDFRMNDETVNEMITSSVDKYIKGSITAEQAANEIDRKAKLFLNE